MTRIDCPDEDGDGDGDGDLEEKRTRDVPRKSNVQKELASESQCQWGVS